MAYIGQVPATGDNSFRILDDIKTFTQTFDGSSSSVVSTANATITLTGHRFITGQRVYYSTTGSAIGNLISGTYYYIIKQDQNNIKFALSYANAINNTSIAITGVGSGTNHTLNVAFDGINTKFKATYNSGTKAQVNRSAQLQISINGVLQQPQDANPPVDGFSIESDSTIVFSTAPAATDAFWGSVIANSYPTFDVSDNTVDTFTGNGSNTNFSLSKTPANNQNVLVTINGVVQYPSDETNIRSYAVNGNVLTFTDAPAGGSSIQVRHIGFAGATSSNVTGFYGRTGNVVLTTADNINVGSIATVGNINSAGIVTAALLSFGPSNNIEIGDSTTGASITSGTNNFFAGSGAGRCNTTGSHNAFLGFCAGFNNTTGSNNTFVGQYAGIANTTGVDNIFIGFNAGCRNTTGNYNHFLGRRSGQYNTTGSDNNFFGTWTGRFNTTGKYNNFFGSCAGRSNTTGSCNNFLGICAGGSNTTGTDNNFFGTLAGHNNSTGSYNTFFGRFAGCSNTTGSNNIAIGNNAQLPSATGSCQLVIGSAGVNWIYGDSLGDVGIGTTNPVDKLDVNGNVLPSFDATYNIGSASKRWNNVFTTDLHLSNEGSSNDVDGTWGQYTIQEGEDDLFLLNRRNGKKYKFVLQEVN